MKVAHTAVLLSFVFIFFAFAAHGQSHVPFQGNTSMSPQAAQYAYSRLAGQYPHRLKQVPMGASDNGHPMAAYSVEWTQVNIEEEQNERVRILIMNGIHAGEPCGVDACYLFVKELCEDEAFAKRILENTSLLVIPFYNVDGGNNRGCCSRANQDGPEEYGFRANGRNLDLNRDLIKADGRTTANFQKLFTGFRPHFFIDTHTSNGADYPYTMTLITSQWDKMGGVLGDWLHKVVEPELYIKMAKRDWEISPYVNTVTQIPDSGLVGFLETPRYSTGYAALFQCAGFVTEAHMLKPFADRVEATYQFILSLAEFAAERPGEIMEVRRLAEAEVKAQQSFALRWEVDKSRKEQLNFKGYRAVYKPSEVSGKDRLFYDRAQPWTATIPYFNRYRAIAETTAPDYYIVSSAWPELLAHFDRNGVFYQTLGIGGPTDAVVETFHIKDFKSVGKPYEGHYLHTDCEVLTVREPVRLLPSDILISTDQAAKRYIIETLEPRGVDSFFAWNFFDSCLQQKEWFSDYVFEDEAARMLAADPLLQKRFEQEKATNKDFAASADAQLYWLYRQSPHFEQTANRLPIYRVSKADLKRMRSK